MQYLRVITGVASVVGLALSQVGNVLPEGKAKTYITAASIFLSGLVINVFPSVKK